MSETKKRRHPIVIVGDVESEFKKKWAATNEACGYDSTIVDLTRGAENALAEFVKRVKQEWFKEWVDEALPLVFLFLPISCFQ